MSDFALVPAIRDATKPCGLSVSDILYKFSNGRFDYKFMIEVEDASGSVVSIPIRWAMCRRGDISRNWSMALLIHDMRFDCLDFEERVLDHRGHECSGWHRHMWDITTESCDRTKECLDGFGTFTSFRDFVRDGCDLMKIVLEKGSEFNEQPDLQFS